MRINKMYPLALVALLVTGCQTMNVAPTLWHPFTPAVPMTQAVQDALYASGDPMLAQLKVETQNHRVLLSGYVKKIRQSDMAEQLARQVPGVTEVENGIIIRQ